MDEQNSGSGGFLLAFLGGFLNGCFALIFFIFWIAFKSMPGLKHKINETDSMIRPVALEVVSKKDTTAEQVFQKEKAPPTYEETIMNKY